MSMKKLLIGSVVVLGLAIIALVVTISMLDFNKYKPKITELVKENSGYDLNIKGDISVSFSPVGVKMSDVSLSKGAENPFVKLKEFGVAIELIPFIFSEIKVDYVLLDGINVDIIKNKNGKFNFELDNQAAKAPTKTTPTTAPKEKTQLPLLNVKEVRVQNVHVNYTDMQSGAKAIVEDFDLLMGDIGYDSSKKELQAISFVGDVDIKKLTYNKYNIHDTKINFAFKDAIAKVNSMTYTIFDSKASANASVDLSGKSPKVSFEESIPSLKLESFSKEILEKDLLQGVVNSTAKLSFVGSDEMSVKKTLNANVLFEGKKVAIKGYDIDKIVKSYNDLKDGDLKKNGVSFLGSALQNKAEGKGAFDSLEGETTAIEHLHVKIDIAKNMANLSDVAIATLNSRVAVKGSVNLLDESLKNVEVAILDKKGCATYSQGISGTLSSPKAKPLSTSNISVEKVQEVIGMVSSLFGGSKKKAAKKEPKECEVFYKGVVAQP